MAKKTDPAPVSPDADVAVDGESKQGLVTRVKTKSADLKDRAEVYREDLEGRRSSNRAIDAVFGSYEHETSVGGPILAGAVAFRFFLFIVPYVFVIIFGFGLGSKAAGEDPADLARRSGIVGLAAHAIQATGDASTVTRIVTMLVATYALLSASRTMVKALFIVHALTWRIPIVKVRGIMKKSLYAIAMVTGMLALELVVNKIHHESLMLWVVATSLFILVPTGLWLLVTLRVFPSAPGVTWKDLWIGALLFGVGTTCLHLMTVLWLSRSFSSKSETYGALGAALTILFWAYILGRLVTASASISAVMWYTNHPPESALPNSATMLAGLAATPPPDAATSAEPPPFPASSPD